MGVTDRLSSDLLRGVSADDIRCSWLATASSPAVVERVDGAAELARKIVVGLRQRG